MASLLLILGGAGALKQVLIDSGVSQLIAEHLQGAHINPYVLGWTIAAIIRVCVGSSTVSGITTAGFIAPNAAAQRHQPQPDGTWHWCVQHDIFSRKWYWLLAVQGILSTFIKDTIKTWSVMDNPVSVTGLLGVLVLQWWL